MAAGLGFKDFTTGEVLTAADVDGYLMQGVWVFASAAARDAAVTSPQEGNFAYLKDTNVTTYYTGSAWANLDTTGMTNPMTTTGDTIYSSSGSTPARLGIGTAGQVLQVNSGATAPEWATPAAGGGMTLISTTTLSGASTTITVAANSYKYLMAFCRSVELGTNCDVGVQINAITTSTYVNRIVGTKDTTGFNLSDEKDGIYFNLVGVDGMGDTNGNNGTITFYDANSTSTGKVISAVFGGKTAGGGDFVSSSFARVQATGVISEMKFIQSGTQYDGGTVLLYGVS